MIKNLNKKLVGIGIFLIIIVFGIVYSKDSVKAAGVSVTYGNEKTYVCYNKSNGDYVSTEVGEGSYSTCKSKGHGYTTVKLINNDYAYCVNWGLLYYSSEAGANYVRVDTWKNSDKHAIMAGYLINKLQKVNSGGYDVEKAYERTGAALNTFFASGYVGDAGSYNYYGSSEISNSIAEADAYYTDTVEHTTKLPYLKISVSGGNVLSYDSTGQKYFSGKVTISGFVNKFGGAATSYTVTAMTNDGENVSICSDSEGVNCEVGSVSLGSRNEDYTFYVFVDKSIVSADDNIIISVNGSNKSTYYSSILYDDIAHDDAQKLMTITEYEVPRSISNSTTLVVPDLDYHRIYVYKVDENGNELSGSSLALYQDSVSGTPLKTNDGNSSMIYYAGSFAEGDDAFYNHNYYLVETNAPDGYVYSNSSTPFYKAGDFNSGSGNVTYCYKNGSETPVDNALCDSSENRGLYTKVQHSNGHIIVFKTNSRNVINISKREITGEDEIEGAILKICTKANYDSNKDSCTAAKNIAGEAMRWTSVDKAHTIYGIAKGDYYIIETTPPKGYIQATTATAFSIDGEGKVVTGVKEITNEEFKNGAVIVVNNQLTDIYISKRDIVTSKELPGATISICRSYVDDDGNYQMLVDQYSGECVEAILNDGSAASWVSTNEPHRIRGLEAGTYYLVERVAPTDYSTAESVLFTLNDDGTLSGPDGTLIEGNNKLIMYDVPIIKVPTGSLTTYIVVGSLVLVTGIGIGCYIYLKKTGKIVKK